MEHRPSFPRAERALRTVPVADPWTRISPWLRRSLPFGAFILVLGLDPVLREGVSPFFDPRWLYGVRAGVAAILLAVLWRGFAELREGPGAGPAGWLLGALVGLVVFGLWILLDRPPFVLGELQGYDPRVEGRIHAGFAGVRLAGAAMVVPVMEELFWRSFIMRWVERQDFRGVDPREVGWKALLVSSGLFALEHRLWMAGFLAGLAYGWLYRRTGSLWVAIFAHAVTNAVLGAWVLSTGSWRFW